jgi:hypothetical protein
MKRRVNRLFGISICPKQIRTRVCAMKSGISLDLGRGPRALHPLQSQASPELIPEEGSPPVLTSPNPLSTLLQRFAALASLNLACRNLYRVSATFTTIAFDDSSLRWLEINT